MHLFRRGFYLLIGFTFPGFWALHASGFMDGLYTPIQRVFHTTSVSWPALISAGFLYFGAIVCFELLRFFLARINHE